VVASKPGARQRCGSCIRSETATRVASKVRGAPAVRQLHPVGDRDACRLEGRRCGRLERSRA